MTYSLLVLLYLGTPNQRWEPVAYRMTWEQCTARALQEIRRRAPGPTVVRCELQAERA